MTASSGKSDNCDQTARTSHVRGLNQTLKNILIAAKKGAHSCFECIQLPSQCHPIFSHLLKILRSTAELQPQIFQRLATGSGHGGSRTRAGSASLDFRYSEARSRR